MSLEIQTSNRVTVCGMTGTGKTTFAREIARAMAGTGQPLMILDL